MPSEFLEIGFPIPLDRTFHYALPPEWNRSAESLVGCRVFASFGKFRKIGYVVGWTAETPSFKTKPVSALLDEQPLLSPAMLALGKWIAEETLSSQGEALTAILPTTLTPPKRKTDDGVSKIVKPAPASEAPFHLNETQRTVWAPLKQAIDAKTFRPFLLRGVTQSGKTELYLQLIAEVLAQGRQAIYLVPEISLTPLFIERLEKRFPNQIGVWHSQLPKRERWERWDSARKGELPVIVGTRSAVLAPLPDVGVIIMDEEHEPSYQQEDRPHYHARDVALHRASEMNAVVVMGSATPSLESFYKAKAGTYSLLELTARVEDRPLPPVTLINRRSAQLAQAPAEPEGAKKKKRRTRMDFSVFSEPLRLAIEQRLARREQVMLFVNRRSFTPFLRCQKCGWVARCKACSGTMALHLATSHAKAYPFPVPADAVLRCHLCLASEPVPIQCPTCQHMRLHSFGVGTQRIEEEIGHLFPFVKIARLDRDAITDRHVYERVYRSFADGELDILVGTQMIAKGFDFPQVTLVGIVDADVTLFMPDFRASERTFQLITQMAGRTGRGPLGGQVIVQTHHPDHPALQFAMQHDYVGFYNSEIGLRDALNYPPFCRIVLATLSGADEKKVVDEMNRLGEALRALPSEPVILGPVPAPHARIKNKYRYQIILKTHENDRRKITLFLTSWKSQYGQLLIDGDPTNLS